MVANQHKTLHVCACCHGFPGPNSIAKCNIEPDPSGRYVVTYVPVEVGHYSVYVKWNGRPIEGEEWHHV